MEISRLSGGESLVYVRENLIFDVFVDYSQWWRDFRMGEFDLRALITTARAREFWVC